MNKGGRALKIVGYLYPLITVGAVFAVWAIAAYAVDLPIVLPTIGATFRGLGELLSSADFYVAVGGTLLRTLIGFVISLALALALALPAAFFKPVEKLLSPLVIIARAVPTMSIILLCLLWVSNRILPVVVSVFIVFPVLYTTILNAVQSVDKKLVQMSKVYKVPKVRRAAKLYIPLSMPSILSGVQSTLGLMVKLVIAAEVMANTARSIGQSMNLAHQYLETDIVLAYTLAAIALSAILEGAVILVKKFALRWCYA